jgi:putative transposase
MQQANPTPVKPDLTELRPTKGRRFTEEQRQHALKLIASGVGTSEVAAIIGTTAKSIRAWLRDAKANGTMPAVPVSSAPKTVRRRSQVAPAPVPAPASSPTPMQPLPASAPPARSIYAPKDPGQGLSEAESAAILQLKREHPSFGPAQIRAQLKRFKGWRIANKAIARVLRAHGYELVHRGSRPQGPEPTRFEAPRRNALWQVDFTELRVGDEKLSLLVVLDDFSRFVVGHRLCDSADAQVVIEVLRLAIARHGKPEAVRSDRGGAFTSGEFARALEIELIDQIVGRPYHPQGGGKVEAVIGTVRRELWDIEHFATRRVAEQRLAEFFADYNERRAHMGIDGLTPADRYFGRADRVLAQLDAISRQRNGAREQTARPGAAVEEIGSARVGAPMEVLRLTLVDGDMELRLCGAAVRLGPVQL